jgi:hypothetical protein
VACGRARGRGWRAGSAGGTGSGGRGWRGQGIGSGMAAGFATGGSGMATCA